MENGSWRITNSGCKIVDGVGDEANKKATFADSRVSDQQDLERQIVVAALPWRTHYGDDKCFFLSKCQCLSLSLFLAELRTVYNGGGERESVCGLFEKNGMGGG